MNSGTETGAIPAKLSDRLRASVTAAFTASSSWRTSAALSAAMASVAPPNTAGDADTCRNTTAEAAVRLAACESVIADDKAPSRSRAYAFWFRGDMLMKRRDYDKALAAFDAAHAADPDNVAYINNRGIAYANKGDDDHALADYEACLRIRPNYAPAYNNRGLILMRRSDFSRALDALDEPKPRR